MTRVSRFPPRTWFVFGFTLLLFLFVLYAVPGTRAGALPFLLAPVLVTIFQPFLLASDQWHSGHVLAPALLYPVYLFVLFLLLSGIGSGPPVHRVVQAGLFIVSFALFLSGVAVLMLGIGGHVFTAQWLSTLLGLLLIGSFVYMSPIIDRYYSNAPLRKTLIYASTQLNPILAIGGRIFEQDLLRGPILYEHLSIGRFYSYSSPNWYLLALIYLLTGGGSGTLGVYFWQIGKTNEPA